MEDKRLTKIRTFFKKNRRLPSYAEMLNLFNLSSKNAVHKIVKKWIGDGWLQKINDKLSPTKDFFSLPLLGTIKAGFPTEADEDYQLLSLDDYLVENPQASFLMRVNGDSLVDIGILPDDLVVIEKKAEANSGEIVLAYIDGEWTLKILRKEKGRVVLISANQKYPPFHPREDLQIFGVVKSLVRKIR